VPANLVSDTIDWCELQRDQWTLVQILEIEFLVGVGFVSASTHQQNCIRSRCRLLMLTHRPINLARLAAPVSRILVLLPPHECDYRSLDLRCQHRAAEFRRSTPPGSVVCRTVPAPRWHPPPLSLSQEAEWNLKTETTPKFKQWSS
jgi:hypothetical protein